MIAPRGPAGDGALPGIDEHARDGSPRETGPSAGPAREAWPGSLSHPQAPPRRPLAVLGLAAADLALAGLCLGLFWFLGGTQRYLFEESAEFGADLRAAQVGLLILRIAAGIGAAGFLLAGLALLLTRRAGRGLSILWAIAVALTGAGLAYTVPALLLLRRRDVRDWFR